MADLNIPVRQLFQYEPLTRQDLPEGRRYIYGDTKLPSVTTILSATKDKAALDAWAARVGEAEAERIKTDAATVGTYMHSVMEHLISNEALPCPTSWQMVKGYEMGYRLIEAYFRNISEVWGSEVMLYYPDRYAGTSDLIAVYRDQPAIVDFKQSNKPKRREWISDYFCQLAAYAAAHDVVHGTSIEHGVVLIAVRDGTTQEFSTAGREFQGWKDEWMRRVEQFEVLQSRK